MGTNFYLHEPSETRCAHCGHDPVKQPLHIGKSSWGWCFSLHIIPEENLLDLEAWQKRWSQEGAVIYNEYKEIVPPDEMLEIVTERGDGNYCSPSKMPTRHLVDGRHCVGHGEGTYDYVHGEFC
jgi:hypothetical protein